MQSGYTKLSQEKENRDSDDLRMLELMTHGSARHNIGPERGRDRS